MERFMVVAKVGKEDFLVRVMADSAYAAEHLVLDQSYCGRHEYGVDACQAFDAEGIKTETFQWKALGSETVSFVELTATIKERNEEIKKADEREELIREIERKKKEVEEMEEKLKSL